MRQALLLALLAVPGGIRAAVSMDTVASVAVSSSNFMNANIVLDSHNNVHVVYVDGATERLKYATLANGTTAWTVSDVSDKKVAPQNDLAVGSNGDLHAVYYQTESPAGVRHARLSGATWTTDSVQVFDGTNTFVSIAVGSDNNPRVVYNHSPSSTTRYGQWTGSAWATVDAVDWTGGPCALAIAPDQTAHFLTVNDFGGFRFDTFVSRSSTGAFTYVELVPPAIESFRSEKVGVAIDKNEVAHVSFFDVELGGLLYASIPVGGVPSAVSVLDPSPGAGAFSDIALNDQNEPMIVYFSTGMGLRSAVFDTTWTLSTLDAGSLNGVGPGVVHNRHNHFLAGYLNGDSNELKFVTDAPRDLSISGTVLDFDGAPIPGVALTLSGGIASTSLSVSASTGGYSADHLFEGFYVLTPSLAGWAFQPTSQSVNPLQTSLLMNFQGGRIAFSSVRTLFNPERGEQVTFSYSVVPGHVSLKVYSLRGTLVRTLVDRDESSGDYSISWDGYDDDGHEVASGIYWVTFEARETKSTAKVAVVK